MKSRFILMVFSVSAGISLTVCGCSGATNTVEMPANPAPAPGPPTAVGADGTAQGTTAAAPQLTP